MIDISKGRYWDLPWSLVSSCSRISPGCKNCWSLAMEKRFHKGIEGTIQTHPERLEIPLKRKKPTVWAVWNDLFHEDVPDDLRLKSYSVMATCREHTFLVLTKRPKNMEPFLSREDLEYDIEIAMGEYTHAGIEEWPLENIWHGLTVCNQAEADAKLPTFLQIPGKKFLSFEPMLGAIEIPQVSYRRIGPVCSSCSGNGYYSDNFKTPCPDCGQTGINPTGIHAVILGGESGPGARPMHPDWVRSVRDQCEAAEVPFFFKQWGEWLHESQLWDSGISLDWFNAHSVVGGFARVTKNKAGRILDGKEHNDLPWTKKD